MATSLRGAASTTGRAEPARLHQVAERIEYSTWIEFGVRREVLARAGISPRR